MSTRARHGVAFRVEFDGDLRFCVALQTKMHFLVFSRFLLIRGSILAPSGSHLALILVTVGVGEVARSEKVEFPKMLFSDRFFKQHRRCEGPKSQHVRSRG